MKRKNWADYWRNSLSDAESLKGKISAYEKKQQRSIEKRHFQSGIFPQYIAEEVFKGEDEETKLVRIVYRPVSNLQHEHESDISWNLPASIATTVFSLWISREGHLLPAGGVTIPRDLLSPQNDDAFTIGSVTAKDDFFTENPQKGFLVDNDYDEFEQHPQMWKKFLAYSESLLSAVCDKSLTNYTLSNEGLWVKYDDTNGASAKIKTLYSSIAECESGLPLFDAVTDHPVREHQELIQLENSVALRKGHSSDTYHLADAQRDALSHTLTMENGEVLAVNGPPGTGKTTFVLSAVASLWINAALEKKNPPVIVAASTNNQAVTNIIDAFGKDFSEGEGEFQGRWLPDITSYGAYFPAKSKEDSAVKKGYQTKGFFDRIETREYIEEAEEHFLTKAAVAFPEIEKPTVEKYGEAVHCRMQDFQETLKRVERSWKELQRTETRVLEVLGTEAKAKLEILEEEIKKINLEHESIIHNISVIQNFIAKESLLLNLFSWLPPVKRKRDALRELFIFNSVSEDIKENYKNCTFDTLLKSLQSTAFDKEQKIGTLSKEYDRKYEMYYDFQTALEQWGRICKAFGLSEDSDIRHWDQEADKKIRFPLFQLAVHYWEAQWLLAVSRIGNLEKEKRKTGETTVKPRWIRRMMITPCIVSTFHSLPGHMTRCVHADGSFSNVPLFNFIDLLIVDEAGQVSPDVAAASFALAQKALVIGDVHQIEPVQNVSGAIDLGNAKESHILNSDNEYESFLETGKSVVNGNIMKIAQGLSKYHYEEEMEPGMFLSDHRRCYDEIISFCNDLCYKGVLTPKRGKAVDCILPPIGHLHVEGNTCKGRSGSLYNEIEAEAIAEWLHKNRDVIEKKYKCSLEEAVGVVTPFTAQVKKIEDSCRGKSIAVGNKSNGLTVGTVHALQGAERKIVLFSPVYTGNSNGSFIDNSPSMLNVAVSRAKDSFVVLGDMGTFKNAGSQTPRGILSKHLFKHDYNDLS